MSKIVIGSELVKELRERTGGGLLECKKALEFTGGDVNAAAEKLRKDGAVKADKKSSRVAADGIIIVQSSEDARTAIMLEINCETDFVAKDVTFRRFAEAVASIGLAAEVSDVVALMGLPVPGESKTIADLRGELVAKVGENVNVRRLALMKAVGNSVIGTYVHGNRIGALVNSSVNDKVLNKDLAMHIVASRPIAVRSSEIPVDVISKEKEIYLAQAKDSGKPLEIIEKMVSGRLQKFVDELTLLNQAFVRNVDVKISDLLKNVGAEVFGFVRFEVGEGIDKETSDFVTEVMAQVESNKQR